MSDRVKLIECPRDAWQGLARAIPTAEKAGYLRLLADCGFGHIDAVSFVSPKYVPQMADSEAVMAELTAGGAVPLAAEVIGIVVNRKGLARGLATAGVTTVGYPHSLSPAFLEANARLTIGQSRELVGELATATKAAGRQLVVYISMAFGNPYRDPWSAEQVAEEVVWLGARGVPAASLADTVGLAGASEVARLVETVLTAVRGDGQAIEVGVHLHSRPADAAEKILAAYDAGCRRFDSALTGLGGCPFAGDELVGNIPTELVILAFERRGAQTGISGAGLERALAATRQLRERYAGA